MSIAPANAAPGPVFCAIDTVDADQATRLAARLGGHVGGIKLGLEFFCAHGPTGVRHIAANGAPLFLDLKFNDIPNTVAGAVRAASALAPHFMTVHASGGPAMLRAAMDAAGEGAAKYGFQRAKILGVTVLTSMDDDDLAAVGQAGPAGDQVDRLAGLAGECGLDGIVCSPAEIARARAILGPDKILMVPGIRPAGSAQGDQKRVMTPRDAMTAGATHLVIGRPITGADDPAAAARAIMSDLAGVA